MGFKNLSAIKERLRQSRRTTRRRHDTLNEYVRYLRSIGLAGEKFYPQDCIDRVARKLGEPIDILECDEYEHSDGFELLRSRGWAGAVMRHATGWFILVRKDLPWSQRAKTLMHELEHIVCGHYMDWDAVVCYTDGRSTETIVGVYARQADANESIQSVPRWKPARSQRLLKREPPEDRDEAEEEAEKRAELALKAAARGKDVFEGDDWLFSERL